MPVLLKGACYLFIEGPERERRDKAHQVPEGENNGSKLNWRRDCVWVLKEVGIDSKKEQSDMEDDPNGEEMDDVNLDDERESHWRTML